MGGYKEFQDEPDSDIVIPIPPPIKKNTPPSAENITESPWYHSLPQPYCNIFLAFLKAVAIIVGPLLLLAIVIVALYALCVYVIIPYPLTFWIMIVMVPYYAASLYMIGEYMYDILKQVVYSADQSKDIVQMYPYIGFIGNVVWFGAGRGIAYLWRNDQRDFTWDTEDHTLSTFYKDDYGWRYDLFFYSTLVGFSIYAVLCIYSLTRYIYTTQHQQ